MRGTGNDSTSAAANSAEMDEDQAALGFKVQLRLDISGENKKVQMQLRWLKGADTVLFESFCGMLKRKLEGR